MSKSVQYFIAGIIWFVVCQHYRLVVAPDHDISYLPIVIFWIGAVAHFVREFVDE